MERDLVQDILVRGNGQDTPLSLVWNPFPGIRLFVGNANIADEMSVLQALNVTAKCCAVYGACMLIHRNNYRFVVFYVHLICLVGTFSLGAGSNDRRLPSRFSLVVTSGGEVKIMFCIVGVATFRRRVRWRQWAQQRLRGP